MKVYITGKITGDTGYLEKFNQAEEMVKRVLKKEVINPACLRLPESCTWEDYMRITIEMLNMAGAIALLPDWRESPRACVEYGYALAEDKYILHYNEILERDSIASVSRSREENNQLAPPEREPSARVIKTRRLCPKCGKPITGKGNKRICDECKAEEQPE